MDPSRLTKALKEEATRLGFDLVGATPAAPTPGYQHLEAWLANGFNAEMRYFTDRLEDYRDPTRLLDGAKSLLMLGVNYRTVEPVTPAGNQGRVSRYAWGADYHEVIRPRLRQLGDFLRRLVPTAAVRGVVDTAPLLERQFARLAGLGWIGKNAMLINQRFGSWLFLAGLLTSEELEYAEPLVDDHCRSCRRCIDACPSGALCEPYQLDARRCASYLTVEHRGEIPEPLRAGCDDRFFGCDACQEVCPWNRETPRTANEAFLPGEGMNPIDLDHVASMDEETFRRHFRHSPLWRARLVGARRNAAVVVENRLRNK